MSFDRMQWDKKTVRIGRKSARQIELERQATAITGIPLIEHETAANLVRSQSVFYLGGKKIAKDLGRHPSSDQRELSPIGPRYADRRKRCADCGGPMSVSAGKRCRICYAAIIERRFWEKVVGNHRLYNEVIAGYSYLSTLLADAIGKDLATHQCPLEILIAAESAGSPLTPRE